MNLRLVIAFAVVVLMGSNASYSQETLDDLIKVEMDEKDIEESSSVNRINVLKHPFIYVIDTLSLPFFDDFSTNRVKVYDAQLDDPNVSLKINYDFKVNGATPTQLDYMREPTFSIIKTTGGDIIQEENPTLFIVLFEDGKVIGNDTGWTNVITELDQGTGLVSFDTLVPEATLINTPDTFYRVADDNTLWTPPIDTFDSAKAVPFINNRFAKTPLTQGVATFDGTDAKGFPYDISSSTTYGVADVLTSKPIRLDSNMEEVYLSFFYQAGGYGNFPDESDSLVVEFFDVVDSTWRFAYKINAPVEEDSNWTDQIFLRVDGRKYLQNGFRFRFKNYATLAGSFDHWHIDYVRLGKDRDTVADDSVIRDIAFTQGVTSMLETYTSVPYDHYLQDPEAFDAEQTSFTIVNLGLDTVILIGLQYEIFDTNGNKVGGEVTAAPSVQPRTRLTTVFPLPDPPIFPDLGAKYAAFTIRSRYTSVGQENSYYINDTIFDEQVLRDYYAYDDGTAEKAYGLTGAGLELAYRFDIPIGDSLRAVYFNFPQLLHDDNDELPIRVQVWEDLSLPPIYEALQFVDPQYTEGNGFFRIELDDPVFVNGSFYVGFRQQEATKIYIGFDANNNAKANTFYRVGEGWFESSFSGALMIRPSFSENVLMNVPSRENLSFPLTVYPNPARDQVFFNTDVQIMNVKVFDLTGRMIIDRSYPGNSIELGMVNSGVYILRALDDGGKVHTSKFVVRK